MEKIDTKLYASVSWSNKPQYAGQRKTVDVFEDLYKRLEQKEMLPEGYFKVSRNIAGEPDIKFPDEIIEVFNEFKHIRKDI